MGMIRYAIAWQNDSDNLGDDLRTLAAMELLPRVDRVAFMPPTTPVTGITTNIRKKATAL